MAKGLTPVTVAPDSGDEYAAEGSQYRLFCDLGVQRSDSNGNECPNDCLAKRRDGAPTYWWKRSAHPHTHDFFSYVESDGYPGRGDSAVVSCGVAVCFCL